MKKIHFSLEEVKDLLTKNTSLGAWEILAMSQILQGHPFAQILELAKVIRSIGHGKTE